MTSSPTGGVLPLQADRKRSASRSRARRAAQARRARCSRRARSRERSCGMPLAMASWRRQTVRRQTASLDGRFGLAHGQFASGGPTLVRDPQKVARRSSWTRTSRQPLGRVSDRSRERFQAKFAGRGLVPNPKVTAGHLAPVDKHLHLATGQSKERSEITRAWQLVSFGQRSGRTPDVTTEPPN
jgi:hypothetical protein